MFYLTMITTYLTHSIIDNYPPNIYKYPNFYKCKEHLYILYPGDMLFIPAYWFHWIFSYNEKNSMNKAISYPILNDDIYNKTTNIDILSKKPFVYHVDENVSFDNFNDEVYIFKSKNHNIYPFNKSESNKIIKNKINYSDMVKNSKNLNYSYNFVCGNHDVTHLFKTPQFLSFLLNKNQETLKYKSLLWHSYSINETPINTGLHYDSWNNFLLQLEGIKVVRLYHPNCHKNLYVHPHVIT